MVKAGSRAYEMAGGKKGTMWVPSGMVGLHKMLGLRTGSGKDYFSANSRICLWVLIRSNSS